MNEYRVSHFRTPRTLSGAFNDATGLHVARDPLLRRLMLSFWQLVRSL